MLVTGATGGVAVGILAARHFEVVASTGKVESEPYLRSLGATSVLSREELSAEGGKPLESTRWAAAVGCVGGTTPASSQAHPLRRGGGERAHRRERHGDQVLRSSSATWPCPASTRCRRPRAAAVRVGPARQGPPAAGTRRDRLDITLDELEGTLDSIAKGGMTGRAVLDVRGERGDLLNLRSSPQLDSRR